MTPVNRTPFPFTAPQAEIERSSISGHPNKRSAFSLLEAILAMALLASVAAVLIQLAYVGRRHLQDANRRFQAQLLCQNRLREILCGIEPLATCEPTPINGSPGWCVTIELEPVDNHSGVQLLKVTVSEETESLLDAADAPGVCSFTLAQWVLDLGTAETSSETSSETIPEKPQKETPMPPPDTQ